MEIVKRELEHDVKWSEDIQSVVESHANVINAHSDRLDRTGKLLETSYIDMQQLASQIKTNDDSVHK